jgi:isoleucyl-tRNA synthetase
MTRWLAPITSFTADEIWRHIPGARGDSVFLETWFDLPQVYGAGAAQDSGFDLAYWNRILAVREAVSRELEKMRVAGAIGSGLDADVDLYCDGELYADLTRLGEELRFVLITSDARVHAAGERDDLALQAECRAGALWLKGSVSPHAKCVRCWHHREDVGSNTEHPELCGRCVDNVAGEGEPRRFA